MELGGQLANSVVQNQRLKSLIQKSDIVGIESRLNRGTNFSQISHEN